MTKRDIRQQNAERRLRHQGYWDHNGQRVSPQTFDALKLIVYGAAAAALLTIFFAVRP